jgi:hypothetical protein
MLNAFCRVAPSVLFSFLAILLAGVFVFAIAFRPRTSVTVQARRFFDFLAIVITSQFEMNDEVLIGGSAKRKAQS